MDESRTAVVRPAGPEELDRALAVWQHAHVVRRNGRPLPAGHVTASAARVRRPEALLLIALDGETVVGTVGGEQGRADDGSGEPVPGLMHLCLLSVAPDRWGRRLGHLLVDAIAQQAGERGYQRLQLWTHADNLRANRLYKSLRFRRTGRALIDPWGELLVHYQRPVVPPP
jgi:ribosomal protein S18 acetylase RimI-like enzyme